MDRRHFAFALVLAASTLVPMPADAWLFEEHANVGRLAVVNLRAPDAATFDRLWLAALRDPGAKGRLCPVGRTGPTHDQKWTCIDFGVMPAVAGDHSCDPADLWDTLTIKPWFPTVYEEVAETERLLHEPGVSTAAKVDAWHQGNLLLQDADPDYLTRASKNNAHFVLAQGDESTLSAFLGKATKTGAPFNATAVYAIDHLAALRAARALSKVDPSSEDYVIGAKAVLLDEAFALHFLEDSFSAGHFVGLLAGDGGTLPERAGTHDYYCEHGLAARTWSGTAYGAYGDAFQTEGYSHSDLEMVAVAVEASLEQVLRVAAGGAPPVALDSGPAVELTAQVCDESNVTEAEARAVAGTDAALDPVLVLTPEPYREQPSLPHFRSEFGVQLRADAAARGGIGVGNDPQGNAVPVRLQSAIQIGLGVGAGFEGLTTRSTDGVFYVEGNILAYSQDAFPQSCGVDCLSQPSRFGWGGRARIPFWLVPGDTVLGALLLAYPATDEFMAMAIKAAEGSMWWRVERVRALGSALSWQIVVGREGAIYFSGAGEASPASHFRMTQVELPVLEVRTKHLFSEKLGNDALVQLGGTLDWSRLEFVAAPTVRTFSGSAYVRLAFDGIFYLGP